MVMTRQSESTFIESILTVLRPSLSHFFIVPRNKSLNYTDLMISQSFSASAISLNLLSGITYFHLLNRIKEGNRVN